jgi:uncharacterized protein (TIGR04255 family)
MAYVREPIENPPLVEALFELRAECDVPYVLVPGALHAKLPNYPMIEESDRAVMGKVKLSSHAFHRFRSDDGTRLVQCGPGLFTVNILGDYGEFEDFEAMIRTGLEAFKEVAKPTKVLRLGVRYVNLIPQECMAGLDQPLRVTAAFPSDVLPAQDTIAMRGLFSIPEAQGRLGLAVSAPHQLEDGRRGCLLDLDFFQKEPQAIDINGCLPWVETGHDVIYQAFRSCLSEELYARLKERKQNA